MITNVPTPTDFLEHGIDYLNLAWEATMGILVKIYESRSVDEEIDGDPWAESQRSLATSLLLAHQGCELIIKGRISEVSPYLLVSSDIKKWPKPSARGEISFEDLRTIDAQDLVKLHDSVSKDTLSPEFKKSYDLLRKRRNTVAHGINKSVQLTAKETLKNILEVVHELLKDSPWFSLRRNHLHHGVDTLLYPGQAEDHFDYEIIREALILVESFERKELLRYFDFDTRRRRYFCPKCISSDVYEYTEEARFALLTPNNPKSKKLYCFTCGEEYSVTRSKCINAHCKGNVIDEESENV